MRSALRVLSVAESISRSRSDLIPMFIKLRVFAGGALNIDIALFIQQSTLLPCLSGCNFLLIP